MNSFNPASFCKITKKKCIGKYDSALKYSQKCEIFKSCPLSFPHRCTTVFCSNKKLNCNVFFDVSFIFTRPIFDKILEKQGDLIHCKYKTADYSLKSNDICLKGKRIPKTFYHRYKSIKLINRLPCPPNHGYECGPTYCSSDSIACEAFHSTKMNASLGFGKCSFGFI